MFSDSKLREMHVSAIKDQNIMGKGPHDGRVRDRDSVDGHGRLFARLDLLREDLLCMDGILCMSLFCKKWRIELRAQWFRLCDACIEGSVMAQKGKWPHVGKETVEGVLLSHATCF